MDESKEQEPRSISHSEGNSYERLNKPKSEDSKEQIEEEKVPVSEGSSKSNEEIQFINDEDKRLKSKHSLLDSDRQQVNRDSLLFELK